MNERFKNEIVAREAKQITEYSKAVQEELLTYLI